MAILIRKEVNMAYLLNNYDRFPVEFIHGKGAYLYDKNGKEYLDFCAGIAVNSLGAAHPQLQAVLQAQASKLWHVSNLYAPPIQDANQEDCAAKLAKLANLDKVFFCNSGTEANEAMMKIVRRYYFAQNHDKDEIITLESAFHGRTMAALTATGNENYLKGFGQPMAGYKKIPANNMNILRDAISNKTAGIMLEVIQGEGGIRSISDENLREIRAICDEFGLIMMIDEIQTGIGRTGKFFGYEWSGIQPDIIALAKGLGGGIPIGAVVMAKKLADPMVAGTHGTTFGGNLLAISVANKVVDIIADKKFLAHVCDVGDYLDGQLQKYKQKFPELIVEIRGKGLIKGIKYDNKIAINDLYPEFINNGVLVAKAGENVLRLLPPLIITRADIDKFMGIIYDITTRKMNDG